MRNRKGFTLIELLAVIVILGILMLIAIPSVTKYIDSSKKETYVKTISNMVDVIRYGVVSETGTYSMEGKTREVFYLTEVELEKGSNKSPYGNLVKNYSYVIVRKNGNEYNYSVQVKDDAGYCMELTDINNLTKSSVTKCENITPEVAPDYEIGDVVTFAGSSWYVIKKSNVEEDYVTLMKEKVLTNSELGNYAATNTYDVMTYYYSDTCHNAGNHGYTDVAVSGCKNNYSDSKVKEYLQGTYINTLGSDNLKEIDGYKIRLITLEELEGTFNGVTETAVNYDSQNPSWVYRNYGEGSNYVYGYWTMSTLSDSNKVWRVYTNPGEQYSKITSNPVTAVSGVRPVINLLKNSIN